MNLFTNNKILTEGDTLAEQLKKTRLGKKLSLEKASEDLNISLKYLEALENGNFDRLPAGVYAKNFLREYCGYLGLDYGRMLKLYETETGARRKIKPNELFSKKVIGGVDLVTFPKIFRNLALAALVLVCLIFLGTRLNRIIVPPKLIINNPPDNLITRERQTQIIGLSDPENQIVINGESVIADSDGNFLKTVSLKSGLNTITIVAQKKYGRSRTVIKQILVEQ